MYTDTRNRVLNDPDVIKLINQINNKLKEKWNITFDPDKSIIMNQEIKNPGRLSYRKEHINALEQPNNNIQNLQPFIVEYKGEKQFAKLKLVIMHELYHILYDIEKNEDIKNLLNKYSHADRLNKEYDGHNKAIISNYSILLESIVDDNKKRLYCQNENMKNRLIESYSRIAAFISLNDSIKYNDPKRKLTEEDRIVIDFFIGVFNGEYNNKTGHFDFNE